MAISMAQACQDFKHMHGLLLCCWHGRPCNDWHAAPCGTDPDGRYIVVRDRLWRAANPALPEELRNALVSQLMQARRSVKAALASADAEALRQARAAVQTAKVGLGERGPVWWTNGAPDCNRHLAKNTPYAAWFDNLDPP